jgi:hypothetical protein
MRIKIRFGDYWFYWFEYKQKPLLWVETGNYASLVANYINAEELQKLHSC